MRKLLAAAVISAIAAPLAAQAQTGPRWEWTHPSNQHPFCRLFVQQIVQDNPDQPLRFTIRNDSGRRVQYTISITAVPPANAPQRGTVRVDNANINEVSVATSTAFRGRIETVRLTLSSCSERR
jgi:hypothetical protein